MFSNRENLECDFVVCVYVIYIYEIYKWHVGMCVCVYVVCVCVCRRGKVVKRVVLIIRIFIGVM